MSRHDDLRATWQPGQLWQTRIDECADDPEAWVPVANGGRSEPAWDERQAYRQRPAVAQPVAVTGLSDQHILHLWDIHVNDPNDKYPLTDADKVAFARAVLAAAKEQDHAVR